MKSAAAVLCLALALALAGCASAPRSAFDPLLADELFAPAEAPTTSAEIFAITDEMRRYLQREVLPLARQRGTVTALTDALYTRGQLKLDYDAAQTRNARDAFAARSGNCLSLVIMTAALARELGLEVRFQNVPAEEAWDRSGDLYFFIGHVNLSIGPRMSAAWTAGDNGWITIDFIPVREERRRRAHQIDEARIASMFMNNRAAEEMAAGRLDRAYAWARAAVLQDRHFVSAYNTLGVIYQKRGAFPRAEQVFRAALAAEPANPHVMGNLANALRHQGRLDEAEVVAAELRRLQPVAPFAWFREGQQALKEGDPARARRLFEREIARAPDFHEFHFWLAVSLLQLGETRSARTHLEKALENSTTREHAAIYSAKLRKLATAPTRTQ